MQNQIQAHFKPLAKDLLGYGFMSALSRMGSLLLLPLLTRVLSMDSYGAVDIIATFIALISIWMKLALPNGLVRYFCEYPNIENRSRFISTLLISVSVFGLFVLILVCLFSRKLSGLLFGITEYSVLIRLGCCIALLNSIASIPQMALRMERRIVAFNMPGLIYAVIYVLLSLYFVVYLKKGIEFLFYSQLLGASVSLLLSMGLTVRYLTFKLSIDGLRSTLKYSLPLLPSLLSGWVNHQVDRLLLLCFLGLAGVAVFGAAAKIVILVTFMLSVFQQGWQPYAMLIIKNKERDELYKRIFNYYAGVFASIILLLVAISPELFSILLPKEYHKGYVIIPWMAGAAILHQSSIFTRLGMLVSEKTSGISIASWTGVILNAFLSWLLISFFGIAGAAIGSFVAEMTFTGLLWRYSLKQSNIRLDTKAIIVVFISYIICSIVILVIAGNTENHAFSLALRLLCAFLGVGVIGYHTIDKLAVNFIKAVTQKIRVKQRSLQETKSHA